MSKVALLLFPHFPMLAHALVTETLRLANRAAGHDKYRRSVFTATDAPVAASNGAVVTPNRSMSRIDDSFELVIALAGYEPLARISAGAADSLRRADAAGATLAGFDSGTMVLAHLGLLAGYQAVLYHETETDLAERWPETRLVVEGFCLDRNRLTAAAGTTPAHALLSWLEAVGDGSLTTPISQALFGEHKASEPPEPSQPLYDEVLAPALTLMETHVTTPLSMAEISRQTGLRESRLLRRFRAAFGVPPSEYYTGLRLDLARDMLMTSRTPVSVIATKTGFSSAAWFSNAYKARFGVAPSKHRKAYTK